MSGTALFALASAGCALSVSGGVLIGFRVIQGIGGAVMSSLTLSLIVEAYSPKARTGPIGLWAAVSGLAVAGGSVVGGLLLSVFPWSSIFWVNVADVAGGQVHAAAAHLSGHALDAAVASFLRDFEFALLLAGTILAAAGVVAFRGLRHLQSPVARERQTTDASISS